MVLAGPGGFLKGTTRTYFRPLALTTPQDLWKRTVEIQITKSKSNELTIVCGWYSKEKMRTQLKFSPSGPFASFCSLRHICLIPVCGFCVDGFAS